MKLIATIGLIFLSLLTLAQGADFSTVLTDPAGKPIYDKPAAEGQQPTPVTLGEVAAQALFATYPDEQALPEQEKFARGSLGIQIAQAKGELALTAEQTSLVKKLIAKAYSPLVVARAWTLLDPAVK